MGTTTEFYRSVQENFHDPGAPKSYSKASDAYLVDINGNAVYHIRNNRVKLAEMINEFFTNAGNDRRNPMLVIAIDFLPGGASPAFFTMERIGGVIAVIKPPLLKYSRVKGQWDELYQEFTKLRWIDKLIESSGEVWNPWGDIYQDISKTPHIIDANRFSRRINTLNKGIINRLKEA